MRITDADFLPPEPSDIEPAWRWNRIYDCIDSGQPIPESVGPRFKEAYDFCRYPEIKSSRSQQDLPKEPNNPALEEAWLIWTGGSRLRYRSLIEACLFGSMPADQIGERLGLPQGVVEWFEFLFYDIRKYLVYPMFVMVSEPLLGRLQDLTEPAPEDLLWKNIAFTFGGDFLLMMVLNPSGRRIAEWRLIQQMARMEVTNDLLRRIRSGTAGIPYAARGSNPDAEPAKRRGSNAAE